MNVSDLITWSETIFDWTWRTSLYAAVLIALVWLLQFVFKRHLTPRWHYAFGFLVLLRLLVPVVPESSVSIFNLGDQLVPPAPAGFPVEIAIPASLPAMESVPVETIVYLPHQTATPEIPAAAAPSFQIEFSDALPWMWMLGVALIFMRVFLPHHHLARWVKKQRTRQPTRYPDLLEACKAVMGVRRPVDILIHPHIRTAAVFGWRKPCLLLPDHMPENMQERELRLVILHELAHIKRHDIPLNWIMIAAQSLHWFNPLVWTALKRFRADRELVCDAMVMKHLSDDEQTLYGETLIKLITLFSRNRMPLSLAPIMDGKHQIKRRIIMIANIHLMSRFAQVGALALLVGLFCSTFTGAVAGDREREGRRERREEPREGEEAAMKRRAIAMKKELGKMKKQIHVLAEQGEHEKAEQLEKKARELAGKLERMFKDHEGRERKERPHAEDAEHKQREMKEKMRRHTEELEQKQHGLEKKAKDIEQAMRKLGDRHDEEAQAHRRKLEAAMRETENHMRELNEYRRNMQVRAEMHELETHLVGMKKKIHALREKDQHEEAERLEREAKGVLERMEHIRREHGERERRKQEEAQSPDRMHRELAGRAEELQRALRELGDRDGREADQKRERIKNALRETREQMERLERAHHEREREPRSERGELERRLRHLHEAAENLMAAGMEDEAHRIMERAERMKHGDRRVEEERERDHERERPEENLHRHVEELTDIVHELREELHDLRNDMKEIRDDLEEDEDEDDEDEDEDEDK